MKHHVLSILPSLLLVCVCGCSSRLSTCGDAVWKRPPLFYIGGFVPDYLLLPEFSLSRPAVYRFRVRELPHPVLPEYLQRRTHERYAIGEGDRHLPEFMLRVSLQRLDGMEIFSHTIQPGDAGFAHFTIDGKDGMTDSRFELPWRGERPPLRSYDVVVEVLKPSPDPGDVAHLEARYVR